MGVLARISRTIRVKINSFLDRNQDPTETLDYSYEKMRDQLQDVKEGLTKVTTQKKRLEKKQSELQRDINKHNEQAHEAVKQGRDDLAERALQKKKSKMNQVEELEIQIQNLDSTVEDLTAKKNDLDAKIEEFRTQKETMKARYEAAEATNSVTEAINGVGDEADIGNAIERVEEEIEDKEARSEAISELREKGELDGALGNESQIDRELNEITAQSAVADELASIKEDVHGETETDEETEDSELEKELELDVETSGSEDLESVELTDEDIESQDVSDELSELKNKTDNDN